MQSEMIDEKCIRQKLNHLPIDAVEFVIGNIVLFSMLCFSLKNLQAQQSLMF